MTKRPRRHVANWGAVVLGSVPEQGDGRGHGTADTGPWELVLQDASTNRATLDAYNHPPE